MRACTIAIVVAMSLAQAQRAADGGPPSIYRGLSWDSVRTNAFVKDEDGKWRLPDDPRQFTFMARPSKPGEQAEQCTVPVTISYTFDALDRLTDIHMASPDFWKLLSYAYTVCGKEGVTVHSNKGKYELLIWEQTDKACMLSVRYRTAGGDGMSAFTLSTPSRAREWRKILVPALEGLERLNNPGPSQ
jgi:hypothetical protein